MSEAHRPDWSAAVARVAAYLADFLDAPEAFRGQQLRGGGPVAEFEALLAERCGFPYCVATSNATTALMGLALASGIRGKTAWFPKDHWEGSVAALRLMGARIRRYGTIRRPRGRDASGCAWLVVSACQDKGATRRWLNDSKSLIVEDSSRLPGISTDGRLLSQADVQVLSFGPGKPLSLGEGGAILFRSRALYRRFVACATHPERSASETGSTSKAPNLCLNGRIHPLAAVMGIAALRQNETFRSGLDPLEPE